MYWELFELVGSSNKVFHTYDDPVVLPEGGTISNVKTELYHGDEARGILSFYIPQSETNLVLTWRGRLKQTSDILK